MLELIIEFADEQAAAARSFHARYLVPAAQILKQRFASLWLAARRTPWLQMLWPLSPAASEPSAPQPPIEDHFGHAAEIITSALTSFERIELWQSAAADHIDAAEYTLQRLLGELATAMPLPVDGAPLRAILAEASLPSRPAKKALAA